MAWNRRAMTRPSPDDLVRLPVEVGAVGGLVFPFFPQEGDPLTAYESHQEAEKAVVHAVLQNSYEP